MPAYRGSSSSSPSPSVSSNHSPSSINIALSMAPAPDASNPPSRSPSARGTPRRGSVDLPRNQASSKGGCWTCRLRRKKCDEQREGDSCRTCIRLTIDCLGWGPKRPEWMRDKQAVEAYKANIKAQLTRAGLIRGQPRASLLQAASPAASTRQTFHRFSAPADGLPSSRGSMEDGYSGYYQRQNGAGVTGFHQLPAASYSDPNLSSSLDLGASFFSYSPHSSTTPLSSHGGEPLDFDFAHMDGYNFDLRAPSPVQSFPVLAGQTSLQETNVMYYFENVRKLHFLFGGNEITNMTYTLIVQEPRGALTNAVSALANLHFTRTRVSQGLEPPDPNPEHSMARYFHDEAYFQLANVKQLQGSISESDVLAALHLVCFSQMSGGTTDWRLVMGIALDWLAQTGLPTDDNPRQYLFTLSPTTQLVVKCVMWIDIFSTITLMRPAKHFGLYKRLLGDQMPASYWQGQSAVNVLDLSFQGLQMEALTGCPDEALLAIAEVSALAHWKSSEQRKGSLSMRELIRRGDDIEKRLRQHFLDAPAIGEPAPLHPNLMQTSLAGDGGLAFPSNEVHRMLSNIFRESVLLYLHTVLSDGNPAVPEIVASVGTIVNLLNQLPSSEVDEALTFPICIAGCLTDDSVRRSFLKSRLQKDEGIGNLMRTCLLMETVWQKRDVSGRAVDWRESMNGFNILLTASQ